MASSGQILDILGKLEKGMGSTQRRERESRKKESKQHASLFRKLKKGMGDVERKGKASKAATIGAIFNTALALTGVGIPLAMASQMATSLAVGHIGKQKAGEAAKGMEGQFGGTKFGSELKNLQEGIAGSGSDVFKKALMDAGVTGLTMGAGSAISKGAGEGLKSLGTTLGKVKGGGEGLKGLSNIIGNVAKSDAGKFIGKIPTPIGPIKEVAGLGQMMMEGGKQFTKDLGQTAKMLYESSPVAPLGDLIKKLGVEKGAEGITEEAVKAAIEGGTDEATKQTLGQWLTKQGGKVYGDEAIRTPLAAQIGDKGDLAGLAELLGASKDSKLYDRVFSSIALEGKRAKEKSPYEYEMPESLGSPRGYYG